MVTGESAKYNDRPLDYYAIDPDVRVGHLPIARCLELRTTTAAQELSPNRQLDRAWFGLEASMAMLRQTNPQTGQPFTTKEMNIAREQVRADFRSIIRSEQMPSGLRARAGLALASVGMQHEMAKNERFKPTSKNHVAYLRGIQTAAKPLLAESERTPEDDELLRTMACIAVLTEYTTEAGWILPAPPRQPWSINAVKRRDAGLTRIVITDKAPEGFMAIPPSALGDELWKNKDDAPHATLAEYVKTTAGFGQKGEAECRNVNI